VVQTEINLIYLRFSNGIKFKFGFLAPSWTAWQYEDKQKPGGLLVSSHDTKGTFRFSKKNLKSDEKETRKVSS